MQSEADEGGGQESSERAKWWKQLWKMKVPPKVHIFWWRVINDFLPSKAELKRRHIAKESHCEDCGHVVEDLFHVSVQCSFARKFWKAMKEMTGKKLPWLHPLTWATDLLLGKCCSLMDAAFFVCGAWSLCTTARKEPMECCHCCETCNWNGGGAPLHEFEAGESSWAYSGEVAGTGGRLGEVEYNTDASFNPQTFCGSGGAVLRDGRGEVLAAESILFDQVPDVITAEALVARDGLVLAVARGTTRLILEMDNLTLVNYFKSESGGRSSIAGIWHEVRELSRSFVEFKVRFVKCDANSAAHSCARMSSCTSRVCLWGG